MTEVLWPRGAVHSPRQSAATLSALGFFLTRFLCLKVFIFGFFPIAFITDLLKFACENKAQTPGSHRVQPGHCSKRADKHGQKALFSGSFKSIQIWAFSTSVPWLSFSGNKEDNLTFSVFVKLYRSFLCVSPISQLQKTKYSLFLFYLYFMSTFFSYGFS